MSKLAARRLLVVEDDALVASLLSESIQAAGFKVETAANAVEAVSKARQFDPDIALLDINLGAGATGVEVAYILHEQYPGIALAILTKHPDLRTAGFEEHEVPPGCGFIRKDLIKNSEQLIAGIDELIISSRKVRQDVDPERPFSELTATQVDVLRLVAQGYTNAEVAKRRDVSVRAVEKILNTIFTALEIPVDGELNPRVEVVRRFIAAAGSPERK